MRTDETTIAGQGLASSLTHFREYVDDTEAFGVLHEPKTRVQYARMG
jgi:hypothetical protein